MKNTKIFEHLRELEQELDAFLSEADARADQRPTSKTVTVEPSNTQLGKGAETLKQWSEVSWMTGVARRRMASAVYKAMVGNAQYNAKASIAEGEFEIDEADGQTGSLTAAQVANICDFAEQGDRIVADGKVIWSGFGNRSGLYGTADDMIREKWQKSGAAFKKKLAALDVKVVQTQYFQNINRDRGRWVVGKTIESAAHKASQGPLKFPSSEREYLGTIGSGRYGSAWDSTFAEISKVLSSGPNTVLMTSVGHPRGLAETAFGPLGEPIYVKLPDGDYESALYVSQNGKMAVISNGQNPPMWSLFMEPDQVDSMYHASKK